MRIRITIEDGTLICDQELNNFPVRLGRKSPSEVVISAGGVSSQHVEIFRDENGKFFLRDMGSRNGTYQNGERISVTAVEFPCTFTMGKKVTVELLDEAIEAAPLKKFVVDSKTARISNLSKRKHLVARMKKRLPFDELNFAPDLSKTLLGKLDSVRIVYFCWFFLFSTLTYVALSWIFTRESFVTALMHSLRLNGSILFLTLGLSLPLSFIFFLFKNGWLLRGLWVSTFLLFSFVKVYYDFFFPFLTSEIFGWLTFSISIVVAFGSSLFASSVLLRGFFPKLGVTYFSILALIVSSIASGFSVTLLWEKKQGGAFVDLLRKNEAPNRVLAGITISVAEFRNEVKKQKKMQSTYTNE